MTIHLTMENSWVKAMMNVHYYRSRPKKKVHFRIFLINSHFLSDRVKVKLNKKAPKGQNDHFFDDRSKQLSDAAQSAHQLTFDDLNLSRPLIKVIFYLKKDLYKSQKFRHFLRRGLSIRHPSKLLVFPSHWLAPMFVLVRQQELAKQPPSCCLSLNDYFFGEF